MGTLSLEPPSVPDARRPLRVDPTELVEIVTGVQNRWPSAGLSVAIVGDAGLTWFRGQGVADTTSKSPVTDDTVFRIGSITKTFTAIAVMQLWEQGLVDLDAPAENYLKTIMLIPTKPELRQPTVRHLLTHTSGIGYWPRPSDVLRPVVGSGSESARPLLPLAHYYRRGLPVEIEPGTKWCYSNHGFAALGQLVEDVTGQSFASYLREHLLDPLGMNRSGLEPSERPAAPLATGYVLRARGLEPVGDQDVPAVAGGGMYSTAQDMARYLAVLLSGGATPTGRILQPATIEEMFAPHFRPDPRIPGMGLGFWRGTQGSHRVIEHGGTRAGYLSAMALAPDDNVGVIVLANTGALDGRGAPLPLTNALLRRLLGLPDDEFRAGLPAHAEVWGDLCGWYSPPPGPMTNIFTRLIMGAGVEVRVKNERLELRPLTPVPAMRPMALRPDDPDDPYQFRVDMSAAGQGTMPVVFDPTSDPPRLSLATMSFRKRPNALNPGAWVPAALAGGATAFALRVFASRRRSARPGDGPTRE